MLQSLVITVVGKSQSRLGFKSRFEPFWWFDLRWKDLIWHIAIRFAIWFENVAIRFEKIAKSRQIATVVTQYFQSKSRDYIIYAANKPPGLPTNKYSLVGVPRLLYKAYGCRPMTDKDPTLSSVGVSSMHAAIVN